MSQRNGSKGLWKADHRAKTYVHPEMYGVYRSSRGLAAADLWRESVLMKTYYLRRDEDTSGNSGCGRVAQVAEFDDGTAVLHWNIGANRLGVGSTEVFASITDLLRIHGHDGRSVLEPFVASALNR